VKASRDMSRYIVLLIDHFLKLHQLISWIFGFSRLLQLFPHDTRKLASHLRLYWYLSVDWDLQSTLCSWIETFFHLLLSLLLVTSVSRSLFIFLIDLVYLLDEA
jgi:hypothetical protein